MQGPHGRQGALAADKEGARKDADALRAGRRRGGAQGGDGAAPGGGQALPGARTDGLGDRAGGRPEPSGPVYREVGRRPKAAPDKREALGELIALLAPVRAFLLPHLSDLHRERDESRCAYSAGTLVWTMLLGFLLHLRTRNRMDARRMEGGYGANILALSGQARAPGARARAAFPMRSEALS